MLEAQNSILLVVDIQERLLPAIDRGDDVEARSAILMQAASRLNVPMVVSEQYPKGLGDTVAGLKVLAPADAIMPKMHFSALGDAAIRSRLLSSRRSQVVMCGVEAHVCVLQSALALQQQGLDVYLAADAISSRRPDSKALALSRLAQAGCVIANVEMVVFEWLQKAGTPDFKELSALIR